MVNLDKLDAILETIKSRWGIPGLGVGIVQDGEIVYARGFGVQSLDTQTPVTLGSIFCVASISKCFVASAVMQLVEAGLIALDAPLIQYLPYFSMDDARYQEITIRQMLSHTSGIPDMDEIEYIELVTHPEYDDGALERHVRALSGRRLVASPGERFAYSNIAFNVLGHLIAEISGVSFETYMQENVLIRAGMPDSTFSFPDVAPDRLAVPHLRVPAMIVNPVYPYHRADAPSSFLHSSIVDMCHWCLTCLNRGSYGGKRILSPASYDSMWTPVAEWGFPPFYENTGLGWTLGHFEGTKTVSHGGMGFGWTDFLFLLPERDQAAVILCNEESSARERIVNAVVNTMLGRETRVEAVSWMVPITQALQGGGLKAAYKRCAEIKDGEREAYFIDEYELINLTYQPLSVGKLDLAIDVLKVNLQAFPEHVDSYIALAKLYLQKGENLLAKDALSKALKHDPENPTAIGLLAEAAKGIDVKGTTNE